jgi:hypothetical protein
MNLNSLNLTSQQQTQFYQNLTVKINELNPTIHWSPQLLIENAIGQIGGLDRRFTIRKTDSKSGLPSSPLSVDVDICEHRRMQGIFWEKLELNHVNINLFNNIFLKIYLIFSFQLMYKV